MEQQFSKDDVATLRYIKEHDMYYKYIQQYSLYNQTCMNPHFYIRYIIQQDIAFLKMNACRLKYKATFSIPNFVIYDHWY